MEVTGVKRSASTKEVDEYGTRLVHGDAERERVLRESDFVVNILPGTEETKRFFNKELFAMMKPSAVYISIGRGITQNEDDLACALRNGVIRGASVDVFEKEPLPTESPLWDISDDKLLLTVAFYFFFGQFLQYFVLNFFFFGFAGISMNCRLRSFCCRCFFLHIAFLCDQWELVLFIITFFLPIVIEKLPLCWLVCG
ncbi:D-isomer specific 2-hydroxyacid dehydrogenase-protein, putative [Trypanosoma cruzi marinkellei]|uniref:D-isomer specific 2-hydroxyacid dehydrogenase-protein, putative n=1 Tax=Trypanosoma cruzi marinkellei TaxID=85056 RepID=K2N1Y9_TRYCR|nr:D-isomer specific 2-hydroxyacid dehydrogenase-protein, putative [Trypanosoma cruzi marinkellei]